jgi:hypothetical protein
MPEENFDFSLDAELLSAVADQLAGQLRIPILYPSAAHSKRQTIVPFPGSDDNELGLDIVFTEIEKATGLPIRTA